MPKIFGHNISTPAAVAIGGGSLLAIYFAYKQHKASSANPSASSIDPVTGLPYSQDNTVDPLTGETYLAEAQQYGSVQAAEQAAAGQSSLDLSSAYGSGGGGQYPYPPNYGGGTGGGGTGSAYATNAQWAQAVEAGLTDIGYSSTDVSAALGRYLSNLPETSAQATIIYAAIAEYGNPPVGSFQVILQSTNHNPGPGNATVPKVVGEQAGTAHNKIVAAGLKPVADPGQKPTDRVTSTTPAGGESVPKGSEVLITAKSQPGNAAKVKVPNVVGDEQSKAYSILSADHLHPSGPAPVRGKVHTVTAQNPKAGTEVAPNTTVHLTSKLS